ncbi:MAG TPA: glycosyltransferase [Acidimicrobiales bacterium]|nr:glycosyltransferase [Acidimicrobiales bacterium]
MTSAALVSVMIPAYEAEAYLGEAIESVLAQEHRRLEVIVVDDGSTDGTGEVARRYPEVRYHRQDNAGNGAARNAAVELATGDYFAFLDADDRFVPATVSTLLAAFDRDPGLVVAYAHVREFVSPDVTEEALAMLRPPVERVAGSLPTNMVMRREGFLAVGPFVTDLRVGTTVDWSAKAAEHGFPSVLLDDVLFERRLHSSNNGIRERAHRADYVRVVKAALDRRRAQEAARQRDGDGAVAE